MPISRLHDFLDAIPDEAKAEIDAISTYRTVPPNAHLMRAGLRFGELFQIQSGCVKYCAVDHDGRETVLIHMTRGDWIGLSEVFSKLPAHWDVVAQTPVRVRVIRQRDFEAMVQKHASLAHELLKVFAHRASMHRLFGMEHRSFSLKERLVKTLYFLSLSYAKEAPDSAPIVMNLSQEELSKVVGSSRQKLNPALKELEREGLLTVRLGGVTLNSRTCLVQCYGSLLEAIRSLKT
ncbi:Crp/Fnr family transcriptional regulator [Pseudomonas sp. GD03721]|nr:MULTISPECIES: Crp/Fnr family transcriptional regulator [unclassified Pseudomonas]MDH1440472.1 Crp/Fnr family transcriptional regulator [Pseudomonas sp. GD03722]WGG03440.1 Crp/Fnr family transcriptional regulator [Pseudomonas sp. GD03721]WGG07608.1 Crp/Fnr family transcriptional regulator [Pseudomonas sp. GD03919]